MSPEITLLLLIIAAAVVLFSFEWLPLDVTALGVLLSLILSGLVPADEAFAGFGSDTVLVILGLLILNAALLKTGVIDLTGRYILQWAGDDPDRLLKIVTISSAALGAFISNTASTAFFLPVTIGAALRAGVSPSKLLMPLAFSSILSSSVTLISTSTNIVVSGLMTRYGMEPMTMFELAPVGVPITIAGVIYLLSLGRRLIPERSPAGEELTEEFGLRPYLAEVLVLTDSKLVGKTLAESDLGRTLDLTVLQVIRADGGQVAPSAGTRLQAGDTLLVEGQREDILKIKDAAGIEIKPEVTLSLPEWQAEDVRLVEIILMPRSPLIGRSLREARFRDRYGLQVLALNRHGETIRRRLSEIPLRMGDVLLIQGHRRNIGSLEDESTRILGPVEEKRVKLRLAPRAIAIFASAIAAGSFGLVPFPVAVLGGAFLMFLTRCITPEEAYRQVEWKVIILIGSMLALGVAMDQTGTARFLASRTVSVLGDTNPVWLLGAFFILTVLLTQPMSNQAAAIVVLPIAIETARQLGLNPRTFAMMIAVAASCSYLTPLEPSCVMVYGPGRYKFVDFLKAGALLTVIIFLIAIMLVPLVWPLR